MKNQKKQFVRLALYLLLLFCLAGCRDEEAPTPTAPLPEPTPSPTIQPTAAPIYTPVFEPVGCRFTVPGIVEIECGDLIVPEDRADPVRMIRLHVAIVYSNSESPAPDPVVYLEGGPGGHTLDLARFYTQVFQPILRERDLILFDQRGIGYSEPSLDCPEIQETWLVHIEERLNDEEFQAIRLEALTACQSRLVAAGVNLSAYNSAASAADLEELRQALGYESWNLFGISYGTRLALTTMRDYGYTGVIRAVILDSVYPPQVPGFEVLGANADRAFKLIFDRCAALEQCNNDYPDLENRFYRLVDALNADPMIVVITDRANRTTYRIPFDGDDLITTSFLMIYNNNRILNFPKMITQVERRVSAILTGFLTDSFNHSATLSEGMWLSVQCFEEMPFYSIAGAEIASDNIPPQLDYVYETDVKNTQENCRLWLEETAGPLESGPVVSDIPTLVLAGDYDPITPPSFAIETAEFLSNSFYFEFEGIGHGVSISADCGMEMVVAFLEQPVIPPDSTCLENLFIGFVPP